MPAIFLIVMQISKSWGLLYKAHFLWQPPAIKSWCIEKFISYNFTLKQKKKIFKPTLFKNQITGTLCLLAIGDHHVWPIKMEQKKVQQIEKNQFIHLYTGCFDGEKNIQCIIHEFWHQRKYFFLPDFFRTHQGKSYGEERLWLVKSLPPWCES